MLRNHPRYLILAAIVASICALILRLISPEQSAVQIWVAIWLASYFVDVTWELAEVKSEIKHLRISDIIQFVTPICMLMAMGLVLLVVCFPIALVFGMFGYGDLMVIWLILFNSIILIIEVSRIRDRHRQSD